MIVAGGAAGQIRYSGGRAGLDGEEQRKQSVLSKPN